MNLKTFKLLFEKQIYNYLGLLILLVVSVYFTNWPGVYTGELWVHYYTLELPDMKRIYFNK